MFYIGNKSYSELIDWKDALVDFPVCGHNTSRPHGGSSAPVNLEQLKEVEVSET